MNLPCCQSAKGCKRLLRWGSGPCEGKDTSEGLTAPDRLVKAVVDGISQLHCRKIDSLCKKQNLGIVDELTRFGCLAGATRDREVASDVTFRLSTGRWRVTPVKEPETQWLGKSAGGRTHIRCGAGGSFQPLLLARGP